MNNAKSAAFWTLVAAVTIVALWATLAHGRWPMLTVPVCLALTWWGAAKTSRVTHVFSGEETDDAARGAARFVGVMQNFALAMAALFFVTLSLALAKIEHVAAVEDISAGAIVRPFYVLLGLLLAYMGNAKARAAFPMAAACGAAGFQARRVQAWVIVLSGLAIVLAAVALPLDWATWAMLGLCGGIVVVSIATKVAVCSAAASDGPIV